ncbi:RIP metalloprotease RseP [Tranquillimonas alkanivorans]|uniref:Zinc metalloprotease n=1 Tax=Tranquillimonas alkanivorans TaxID=441119 RepID=A0A1I5NW22_9RHOB|nr:RIP metalloprotease RseP [Tranquillimonas alkanivorans]SFP25830.1 regulator of sigma E protease [Tranquillimonas alkanivorans]
MDIIGLLPSFGGFIYTIAAFVVALSVIVAVHEYGHYIVGRWSGIHAEVFSIGFGPVLASRYDKRGTKWQIAALPFGGYVKFLGDSDPSSGRDAAALDDFDAEERRRSMHGAPLWARAATVAAGPVFNFILSIFVFGATLFFSGVASDPLTVDEVRPLPVEAQGLQPGDEILSIAGYPTPPLDEMDGYMEQLPREPLLPYEVRRDGEVIEVRAPHPYPPLVGAVSPQSAALDAGLREGDVILSVDGEPVSAFEDLRAVVGESDGGTLLLEVWRPGAGGGEVTEVTLAPRRVDLPTGDGGFETRWLIGITSGLFFEPATQTPGPFEALSYGARQTVSIVESSLSGLYHMAVGAISSCNLSGPITIAQTSGDMASQGVSSFIWFIAVLSTAVGLLNLFPIPVLDGGHLVFHAFEAVAGRPPSDRAMRVLMSVGLALIGTLMVFALTNDLFCP